MQEVHVIILFGLPMYLLGYIKVETRAAEQAYFGDEHKQTGRYTNTLGVPTYRGRLTA